MRHLTRHCIFPDIHRLWQIIASVALNRAVWEIQGGLCCPDGGPWRQGRFFVFRPDLSPVSSKHYLMAFLCYYTFLGFYNFYEFFWAVTVSAKPFMWTFMIFFDVCSSPPLPNYPSMLNSFHGFALPCLDLEVPTCSMYRIGLDC